MLSPSAVNYYMNLYNSRMVVTLTGENGFGLQRELNRVVEAFVAGHGDLALERLDGQDAEPAKINEALTSLPFLSDRKMVILRMPGANKTFVEQAEQLLGNVPETTDVIIIEPKLDKRLGYYKYLQKHTDFRAFPQLDQSGLAHWLVVAAKESEGSISSSDARYLVERIGPDQQTLFNELQKLLLYEPKITRQTIDLLTDSSPQSTIFQLLEAAFAGNAKRALELYAEQRALKVEPAQIISMLAWQLHILAILKTAGDRPTDQIAREAKINPYVLAKSQSIARALTLAQLKKLINDLLVIDLKTKRTNLDADEALQHYLLQLSNH